MKEDQIRRAGGSPGEADGDLEERVTVKMEKGDGFGIYSSHRSDRIC